MTFRKLCMGLPVLAGCSWIVSAAPTLRLSGTDLRPVWIQQGTNGPTNVSFEALNAGDGILNPEVRGSHPWLTPAVDAPRVCSFDASNTCRPIRVLFNATALTPGVYDGKVIVTDPNAVDAPQSVKVRVYVNGNVPERLDFYLPPDAGANEAVSFQTPAGPAPSLRGTTQTGGNWLAVSSSGMGSFQFLYTHRVQATVQGGMAAGEYGGSLAVSGSSFSTDNKTAPVALHVTAQPIARTGMLRFRVVQGGSVVEQALGVVNSGRGTLALSGATASGGAWLTATFQEGAVRLRVDSGSLAPGFYNGSVSVASNAANNPLAVPVELEVQAASAPRADFGGLVDAASFDSPVGPGALVSLFGSQLAGEVALASSIPLPTTLVNTTVFVNNVAAPLIFVSPGQINFQMPVDASGVVQVRVERQGQRGNTISAQVARRGPGLYGFPGTTYGIVVNASRTGGLFFAWPDIPALAGVAKAPAKPGDVLVLYGSGFGPVNPQVATGAAAGADPISAVTELPRVSFGRGFTGPYVDPLFVGMTPGFVGLFQVNVQVPQGIAPNARNPVRLDWPDGTSSNIVEIAVER